MSWKTQGCYLWRTRKPGSMLGLPFIGRHNAYVGQTSSRYHRDRQHEFGGGAYGAVGKPWSDLDPKVYPLPCLFPSWKWSRLLCETLWTLILWPVYSIQKNRWNPRRIKPRTAERQRWRRDAARARGWGISVDIQLIARKLVVWLAIAAIAYLIWSYQ